MDSKRFAAEIFLLALEQVTALRIEFDWLDDEIMTTTTQLDRICCQGVLHRKLYRKFLRERKCAFNILVVLSRSRHKVSITVWIGTITATATASVGVIITTPGGSGREGTLGTKHCVYGALSSRAAFSAHDVLRTDTVPINLCDTHVCSGDFPDHTITSPVRDAFKQMMHISGIDETIHGQHVRFVLDLYQR